MTAETQPRLKITYATLRNDNDELHAQFEAGAGQGARRAARPATTATSSAARERDGDGDVREALARSTRRRSWARSPRARAQDVQDAIAAARAAFPAWAAGRGRSASRSCARPPTLISERQMEFARAAGDRGRQEPARGARRRRGDGRPDPLLRATWSSTTTASTTPMGNLGDAAVHTRSVLRPHGVFARHQPVQLPDGAVRRPGRRRARGRQHGRLQAELATRRSPASSLLQACATPACPTACSTWSWARARRSATSSRRTRASTASSSPARSRSACDLFKNFATALSPSRSSSRWAARTRRSCRATPTSTRRPRASCAPRSASAARSARRTAASTSSGRSTTSSSGCSSRRPRRSRSATRSTAQNWLGPGHRPARGRPLPARPSPRRAATAASSPAASA